MLNATITQYHDHIANRRGEEAISALHRAIGAHPNVPNAAAKLRLAADILDREDAVGDWPGADVIELMERALSDVKTVVANLELKDARH